MKKILVPLDGSAMAEQALDVVEEMLDRNIRLVLVRVLNPLTLAGADFTKQEAKDYLSDQAESFQSRHPDIEVACFIEEGLAANKIIDLSRRRRAHRDDHPWLRRPRSLAHGKCGREGGPSCPLSRSYTGR